jgi:hypothetical protein
MADFSWLILNLDRHIYAVTVGIKNLISKLECVLINNIIQYKYYEIFLTKKLPELS